MGYYFFFSYKRTADTAYQRKFFDDLSREIRKLDELADAKTPVGFFDQQAIESGEEWAPAIADALQDSKVLVCICSPKYFKSEYCGREWKVFDLRREAHRQIHAAEGNQTPFPIVIKPVLWLPMSANELTGEFKNIQLFRGTREEIANREGLSYILPRKRDYRRLYNDYITLLARQIIEAHKFNLKPLPNLPPLREVPIPEAFRSIDRQPPPANVNVNANANAIQPAAPQPQTFSIKASVRVRFIFVAGDPNSFGGVRQPDAYLQRGGADWKPFHPTPSDRIARIVQRFIADEEVDYDIDVISLDQNLIDVVDQAYRDREIVVLIVDGWTVSWDPNYRTILQNFDLRNRQSPFYNCSVLVPWNESDLELKDKRDKILETVRETFYSRAKLFQNPVFYRDSIASVDDLIKALREALTNIRTELHARAEERRPVPAGFSKPIVSNETSPRRV